MTPDQFITSARKLCEPQWNEVEGNESFDRLMNIVGKKQQALSLALDMLEVMQVLSRKIVPHVYGIATTDESDSLRLAWIETITAKALAEIEQIAGGQK